MRLLPPDTRPGEDGLLDGDVVVAIPRKELMVLSNALTEALEAVEEWEFGPRLGLSAEEAAALRATLRDLLRRTRRPS